MADEHFLWKSGSVADLVKRLRVCAASGADPTKWDYISLMDEAADAIEFLEEVARR